MDPWSGPFTVIHEVVEHLHDVIDRHCGIGARQDVAERVEGRVPLERGLIQIRYPLCPSKARKGEGGGGGTVVITLGAVFSVEKPNMGTHCSGARKASVAVWGSLKERPSLLKGTWVSPVGYKCTYEI